MVDAADSKSAGEQPGEFESLSGDQRDNPCGSLPCGFSFAYRRFQVFGVYVLSVEDRIRPLTAAHLLGYFLGCLGFEVDSAPQWIPQ